MAAVHAPVRFFNLAASATARRHAPPASAVALPAHIFGLGAAETRQDLMHRSVVAHLASLRQGTAASKARSQISRSGKKLRPQKGTGRARLGDASSPMLRGGAHAFAKEPKGPHGWDRAINRKEEALAVRHALSARWREGKLDVVDRVQMRGSSKTRELRDRLASRGWLDALFVFRSTTTDPVTRLAPATSRPTAAPPPVITGEDLALFELAAGNLPHVRTTTALAPLLMHARNPRRRTLMARVSKSPLSVHAILSFDRLVVARDALDELCARADFGWPVPEHELDGVSEADLLAAEHELVDEHEGDFDEGDFDLDATAPIRHELDAARA